MIKATFAAIALFVGSAVGFIACTTSPSSIADRVVVPGLSVLLLATAADALDCDEEIAWSVVEGAVGGTVVAGKYTAPSCGSTFIAGTYHVRATGCAKTVTIPVVVSEQIQKVEIICAVVAPATVCVDPANVEVEPGGTIQFHARVTATCTSVVVPPISAGACQAAFCQ